MKRESIERESIFVIRDFLSAEECQYLIERSEILGYERFTIAGEVFPEFRNNSRVILEDSELAETLWERVSELIPPSFEGWSASGFNPRFRFYRYIGSEAFVAHHDGSVRLGDRTSKLTFMVYLNNVAKGGETRFYGPGSTVKHSICPEQGKALVFDHLILHEGVAVEEGCKYVLRTDVMFQEQT